MDQTLAKVKELSLPTQAVLLLGVASIVSIAANIVLALLGYIFGFIKSATTAAVSKLPARKGSKPAAPSTSTSSLSTPSGKQPQQPSVSLKHLIKTAGKGKKGGASGPDRHADSELFLNGLRGHTDAVTGLAFSSDGKYLATACEDRVLRVFDLSGDLAHTKIPFRYFDNLRHGLLDVAFGVNSTQLALLTKGTVNAAGLCFVDISQKEPHITADLESIFSGGSATNGLCLRGSGGSGAAENVPVIVAAAPTTELRVYLASPSLPPLSQKIDTGGFNNYWAAISNDGRFIAAATFASDVKIYEVEFDRTGNSTGVHKVMDLKGHRKKITALEFSPDGRQAVTASEDGLLKIWNLAVRYKMQEDPKAIITEGLPSGKTPVTRLAWGRGGHIAAVAGSDIYMLLASTGKVVDHIQAAHSGQIHDLVWSPIKVEGPQGTMTLLATAGSDSRVRLWRGPWHLY